MQNKAIINPIDAQVAAPNLSPKYGFVNSRKVLDIFEAKGWTTESQTFAKTVKPEKAGFQKHIVWLKNTSLPAISGLSAANSSEVRLALVNSHDGTTRLNLFLGIMRHLCLNQILSGSVFRYFGAVHSANIVSKLDTGIDYVVNGIPEMIDTIQYLQSRTLSLEARDQLAREVLKARFENVNNLIGYDARIIERALRAGDEAQDAYTVLNRLQEYLIRGGVPYSYQKTVKNKFGIEYSTVVNTRTRKLASIQSQIRLNELALKTTIALAK